MNEKAKLCAIFPAEVSEPQKNLLRELERRCNVEFVVKETHYAGKDSLDYAMQRNPDVYVSHAKKNEVLQYVEESKGGLDGMILFPAHFDRRFFLTGLPTLFVDYVPSLQIGFKDAVALGRRYETKFVTATYGSIDVSKSVAEARMDDLVEKIELFNSIRKMKSTKIMDVQVRGFGSEPHEHWWRLNQEEYLQKLKESLGMSAVIVDYRDLFKECLKAEEEKARKIAEKWMEEQSPTKAIRNRRNVGGVTKEEVTKAAKLYLAGDKMMKELGCNAITMDATTWAACESFAESIGEEYLVSGSLPLTEFRLHGIPTCCQSDMEGLVTQALGEYVSGRPGLHGDFVIDPFNEVAQIGHCNAPINPYGDDRRVAYSIGGESLRRPQVYADLPQEGPVTTIKANVLQRKISIWTGELVPGESIYKDFFESYCCNKLVAKTNAKLIYDNYDYRTFGNHNCCFYGDFRDKIKYIASLVGFEVVEQDK
ncbi:MAG: hypothetical protein KAV99_01810 [Candidatus Latescibacteria bacterium]|nr:hypothetical protein [Candidatus Latescibacterota bacterium]